MNFVRRRRAVKLVLLLVLLGVCFFCFRGAGHMLVRLDGLPSDVPYVAVLMGDSTPTRADRAFEFLNASPGTRLLLVRERESGFVQFGLAPAHVDLYARYLTQRGVPTDRLVLIDGCATTSTMDEARCLLSYLQGLGPLPDHLPVITSWYHTARAGWTFDQVWQDSGTEIEMVPAQPLAFDPGAWWRREETFLAVHNEYLKWAYWLFRQTL